MKKIHFLICFLLCLGMGTVNAQYSVIGNFNNVNIDPSGAAPEGSLTSSVTGDTLALQ